MGKIKIINDNKAVAGVIEALLIVALVSIIISTIQLIYIPEIMKQRESDHMEDIENQFSFLKAVIDMQSMEKKNVPITSTITLGSRELPYFVTARSFGELMIIGMDNNNYMINIDYGAKKIPLTSIRYEAINSYFIDQIYAIEGGSIILKQNDGETVRVEPTINIENRSNEINIYYDIPIIIGISGKNQTSGYKNCFIRTNFSNTDNDWISYTNISNINITTEYPEAWHDLLDYLLENNVNLENGSSYLKITRKNKLINLFYKETYFYAQISPGWII
jgi:competence protein ComGC